MIFWIIATLFTLIAMSCVLFPLIRKPANYLEGIEHDKAHYKQRLKEIDKDEALSRISSDEAEAARAQEGRQLIAVSKTSTSFEQNDKPNLSNLTFVGLIAALSIPLIAGSLYFQFGNPSMPDQSLTSRIKADPVGQPIEELVARAEAHLAKSPNDARGWTVIAPVYTRTGRYEDAVRAWSNVLRLAPNFPEVRSLLGEAILATTDGVLTDKAFKLFQEELAANPASARARYYIATGLSQSGKHEEAAEAWLTLLKGANSEAPWYPTAFANMNQQREKAGLEPLEQSEFFTAQTPNGQLNRPANGPTKEQIEDASNMSAQDRSAMIEGMVTNLAEKLKDDPSDKEGWQRLIRAYRVMGNKDAALSAIEEASKSHQNDETFMQMLNQQKTDLLEQ